eukprot:13922311-Ditylum_brightwellii.AAC.1
MEELVMELGDSTNGFMGSGAFVEAPQNAPDTLQLPSLSSSSINPTENTDYNHDKDVNNKKRQSSSASLMSKTGTNIQPLQIPPKLTIAQVSDLPIVTAVMPDSQAERDGIVVGDRIVAVGAETFVGLNRDEVLQQLNDCVNSFGSINDVGKASSSRVVVVAKAIMGESSSGVDETKETGGNEQLLGYRVSKVNFKMRDSNALDMISGDERQKFVAKESKDSSVVEGGNYIVHYKLLQPSDSLFQKLAMSFSKDSSGMDTSSAAASNNGPVGYI